MKNRWTITLEDAQDGSGDLILPLPQDLLNNVGWQEGDVLNWTDLGNGTWSLSKKNIDVTLEEEEAWKELEKKINDEN